MAAAVLQLLDIDLSCEQEWRALDTQCAERLLQDAMRDDASTAVPSPALFLPSRYDMTLKEAMIVAADKKTKAAALVEPAASDEDALKEAPSVTADTGSDDDLARRDALEVLCSILGQNGKEGHGEMQLTVNTKEGGGRSPRSDDEGRLPEKFALALSKGQQIAASGEEPLVSSENGDRTSLGEDDVADGSKPRGRKMSERSTSTDSTAWTVTGPSAKRSRRHSDASTVAPGASSRGSDGEDAQRYTRAWLDHVYSSVRPFDGKMEDCQSGQISLADMSAPPELVSHDNTQKSRQPRHTGLLPAC
jgi:hypothetical protein